MVFNVCTPLPELSLILFDLRSENHDSDKNGNIVTQSFTSRFRITVRIWAHQDCERRTFLVSFGRMLLKEQSSAFWTLKFSKCLDSILNM